MIKLKKYSFFTPTLGPRARIWLKCFVIISPLFLQGCIWDQPDNAELAVSQGQTPQKKVPAC